MEELSTSFRLRCSRILIKKNIVNTTVTTPEDEEQDSPKSSRLMNKLVPALDCDEV